MRRILHLLFPPKCPVCGELLEWYGKDSCDALCPSCRKGWEDEKLETCGLCAKSVTDCLCVTEEMRKAKCRGFCKTVYYRHGKSKPVQNRLIYYVKRHREQDVFRFLGSQLLPCVEKLMRDEEILPENAVITYVPRSQGALLQYGVDQARELARELSLYTEIPCVSAIRRRGGVGRAQKKLDLPNRLKNAGKSYGENPRVTLAGKDVLLVDDIVTSGATMAVCVRLLRRMGAERVYCVAVAADDMQRDGDGMAEPGKKRSAREKEQG